MGSGKTSISVKPKPKSHDFVNFKNLFNLFSHRMNAGKELKSLRDSIAKLLRKRVVRKADEVSVFSISGQWEAILFENKIFVCGPSQRSENRWQLCKRKL